jgi:CSLREA domain-containing protein
MKGTTLRTRKLFLLSLSLLLAWAMLPRTFRRLVEPTALAANTFTVDTTGDGADTNPGDGVCQTSAGHCSLRAAIQAAAATRSRGTLSTPTQPAPPQSSGALP